MPAVIADGVEDSGLPESLFVQAILPRERVEEGGSLAENDAREQGNPPIQGSISDQC